MLFGKTECGWVAQAPAKVNLFLRVIARRPDGYHELETVMAKVSLWDSLHFTPLAEDRVVLNVSLAYPRSLGGMELGAVEDNLVFRATQLLREETGCRRGVSITLTKRIPAAAGLGGGSSDAATTLRALNALWELGLTTGQLCVLAARLGSDVPFFVADAAWALCTGRGEELEPLPVRGCLSLVIARPQNGLSTAAVYRNCRPEPDRQSVTMLQEVLHQGPIHRAAYSLLNSLQAPAEMLSIDVRELKDRFERLPLIRHQLTGSGSAYFGICRDARQARRIARQLRHEGVPWVVAVSTRA